MKGLCAGRTQPDKKMARAEGPMPGAWTAQSRRMSAGSPWIRSFTRRMMCRDPAHGQTYYPLFQTQAQELEHDPEPQHPQPLSIERPQRNARISPSLRVARQDDWTLAADFRQELLKGSQDVLACSAPLVFAPRKPYPIQGVAIACNGMHVP